MHLLINGIQWDTEGETLEECRLPETVVMLDAPDTIGEVEEDIIGSTLSDAFGFCHYSWNWERLTPVADTHAGGGFFPTNLALCRYPN
jgi:hypothetical protein